MQPCDYALTRRWMRFAFTVLDRLGALVFRPRPLLVSPPREILVIRLERFGDAVLLLPALARLRQLYPRARIAWLSFAPCASFAAATAAADRVVAVRSFPAAFGLALRRLSRRRRFDLALEFHADPRAILLARLFARRTAGDGLRGLGFLLDSSAPLEARRVHASERALLLVESAAALSARANQSLPPRRAAPALRLGSGARAAAARLVPDSGFVIVHPGCAQPSKHWPFDRWQAILAHVAARGWRVVLTGSSSDRNLCAAVAADSPARNLAGLTSWETLAALVARAACVLASDTGIVHLAAALGTPSIALFGPNDPAIWGYSTPGNLSLVRRLECSFCARARCPRLASDSAESAPCLAVITADEVIRAFDSLPLRAPAELPPLARHALPA